MRKVILDILVVNMMISAAALALASPCSARSVITEIIDFTGDGAGNTLDGPVCVAVDGSGNVYVTGIDSTNAFKITPGGVITEIIDVEGDGAGNIPSHPIPIAVDESGNVYVVGYDSSNAFKITPGGLITEIIDGTGDGAGHTLSYSPGIAVDGSGNVYVTGMYSDNAFKITTPGTCSTNGTPCTITEIIDSTGDGAGHGLDHTFGVAVDGSGNVWLSGRLSGNAFKIATPGTCSTAGTPCTVTEVIDGTGDGKGNTLSSPTGIAVGGSGNLYIAGRASDNAFMITPGGVVTEIIDATGDGSENTLSAPQSIAVDASGNVYIAGRASDNAFMITPGGVITEIVDSTGDGAGHGLTEAYDIAVDGFGDVYVTGAMTDNAFKIQLVLPVPALSNQGLVLLGASLVCVALWVARRQRLANA